MDSFVGTATWMALPRQLDTGLLPVGSINDGGLQALREGTECWSRQWQQGDRMFEPKMVARGPTFESTMVSTLIVVQRNAFLESSLSLHTVLTKDKERQQNESHGIISSHRNTAAAGAAI